MIFDKNWRKNPKWLQIRGISLENCINKTGPIEEIPGGLLGNSSEKNLDNFCAKINNGVINFGKYKNKSIEWLEENDPNYLEWAAENVSGFEDQLNNYYKTKG